MGHLLMIYFSDAHINTVVFRHARSQSSLHKEFMQYTCTSTTNALIHQSTKKFRSYKFLLYEVYLLCILTYL
jgi:hypothetical protein